MRLLFTLVLAGALAACGGTDSGPPPLRDLGPRADSGPSDLGAPVDANGWDLGPQPDLGPAPDLGTPDDAGQPDDGAVSMDADVADASSDLGLVSMPCTATGACDPFVTDSCGAGFSCRPNATGMTECLAIAVDAKVEGATCVSGGDCQPGLLCLNFGGGFTCNKMCPQGSLGFCGGEDRCFGTIGDACVQVCRPRPEPCDIYLQNCPLPGDACSLATDPETRAPYTGCRLAGTVAHGDLCGGTAGACAAGLICIRETVDGGSVSTCKQVCGPDAGAPMCTFGGEACTGFARTWGVGYCRTP